ncbi:alpha/beta fold hydrolase [Streptomyces sp. NEAU-Y11]|uniref:alpha/beta fold hydrolase n=1 Tax=Streptomyces cucumeris TaxID=2962890 RepID=UPI0020C8D756|nr:alpha/beta fold hydrolase [Streptomyces sp. NEAU-Y11]MCP9209811.1 alpha/beta hydrolase [Streptomyces sp. NEAU-Y11]
MTSTSAAAPDRVVRGTSGFGLLLAHGATGSVEGNYGPLLNGLAGRYRMVGADYPGSGRSPVADGPLELDALADRLVAVAVEEGLETFAVSGYSLGGAVAVRAAVRHPERVAALVLTAAFARPSARMEVLVDDWLRHLRSDDPEAAARWMVLQAAGAPFLDRMTGAELAAVIDGTRTSVPPGAADQVELVGRVDIRADLERITVPTLVISTAVDAMVTPYHHRQLADGIPGARYAEIPSGHLPFVEAPDAWLELIGAFLDENATRL